MRSLNVCRKTGGSGTKLDPIFFLYKYHGITLSLLLMFFIDEGSWFPAKQIQTAALGFTSVIIEVLEKNMVHLKNIDLFDFVFV